MGEIRYNLPSYLELIFMENHWREATNAHQPSGEGNDFLRKISRDLWGNVSHST